MDIIKAVSSYAVPAIFAVILIAGMYRDVKVYDIFVDSAKEGITTVVKIIPPLVGLIVATGVFRASGALELLIYAAKPIAGLFNIPSETLPLVFIRPISGSASLALLSDILKEYGADSFIGRVASTMMGSTETIFYTLTVYFGAVGVKKVRYTLLAALMADFASAIVSVWICTLVS
ncbi:MAG TPA: spore maturation protein [Ruminiclostridium sp.]|mgnify:CR=1 FL=1|jgi:spore maturation protein B|uniref:Spore maturation protein n=1 Tax=Acetivibrio saccincola TaxID=1677857 RepID=A0A2K9E623_9FIRM|nr:nucleoside recognition domain-containing protein [Acetivibrio saccincola]HAA43258.1 spore maturation protein [Ruminiclostridium sp.]AUG58819.1 Spore maturation protein B [Acetivibrio saccincola]NLW25852.1 spore maturation protein [Acetivibrio saccincola]PQQ66082.1 spore maturation protein [Acetivibrio saccincola]HOA96295.1 spore maturation protein [Acetivibrio saccincola]